MQKLILLLALFAAACLPACHDHNEDAAADFTVTFKATFDGDQLTKYKDYPYGPTAYPLQFSHFTTYLSDIELLKSDGTTQLLSEIEFVNFTPDNAPSDLSATPIITYKNVPEGEYTGLRIGYGVKPSLNAKKPSGYATDHPLAKEGEYWPGWNSYIFNKIEGQGDADNNDTFDHFLLFHCGSDAVYKVYSFDQPIHVHAGQPGASVVFDLKKVFTMADGTAYDIVTNFATSNNPSNVTVAQVLMTNFEKATAVGQ